MNMVVYDDILKPQQQSRKNNIPPHSYQYKDPSDFFSHKSSDTNKTINRDSMVFYSAASNKDIGVKDQSGYNSNPTLPGKANTRINK
jgi:hypothetical protein